MPLQNVRFQWRLSTATQELQSPGALDYRVRPGGCHL